MPSPMFLSFVSRMTRFARERLVLACVGGAVAWLGCRSMPASATESLPGKVDSAFVVRFCVECHDGAMRKGGLDLERMLGEGLEANADAWEKVVRRTRARQMPPAGKERPDEPGYDSFVKRLSSELDLGAERRPNPGRADGLRRLNRTEYRNAIRDLLALEIDATALLPKDDAGHGFDNVTVGHLSPTLLERYLSAAQKISRLAIGAPRRTPGGDTFRVAPDVTQEEQVEGLPPGTRGGLSLSHTFVRDGTYEIQARLTRDRNEEIEGLHEEHEVEILVDRERVASFTVAPPRGHRDFEKVDGHLRVRIPIRAGPHAVAVTFVKKPSSLPETRRQPYQARFNMHRHPRRTPALFQVSINGPYESTGPGDTPSRRRVLVDRPATASAVDEDRAAEKIVATLARRAFRRPVEARDLERLLAAFRMARAEDGFEAGIESALAAILASPEFLFRIERDPPGMASGQVYRVGDVTLASRLSFFLWSSIPDDELLDLAVRGELHRPRVMEKQVRRMLVDERTRNLAGNFAGQWLHLRNLESITPDLRLFPDFDDNLRQAFRTETEMFLDDAIRSDRSVPGLLSADYTFLNERLAKHYGIPHVYGSRFRKVPLGPGSGRGGLLRQGSILTVTSYATRTSPVLRGQWVLANLLGTPPPPPPADVPALKENPVSSSLPVRERLAEHRANPACASCHDLMDPVGFALENFDAIGRWRTVEDGRPVDAAGGLPDGRRFTGVTGLEEGMRARPELVVGTLVEKLLTFALGRGIEPADGPAVRRIVGEAAAENYRFSAVLTGIARSTPFLMRRTP